MMSKLKYLFIPIFCAVFIIGAANGLAQTNGRATKSDVAGMIEFYEWAFETDFSPEQRGQFQRLLEKDFRDDAAKARRDTDNVLGTFVKIKQMSAESRRETRRIFLNGFLPELKSNESSDPGAKFLLAVFRDSHNGKEVFSAMDAATGDVFDKRADRLTNGDGSPNLIGKWSRGAGSGYVNYTGKTQYKSGETYTFEFSPDGTMEYAYDSDVLSIVQCRTKETSKARGRYTISGETLTINLAAGNAVGSSSCEAKNNFRKTTPAATITKKFIVKRMESITRPDRPMILCFDGQDDSSCFEKVNK